MQQETTAKTGGAAQGHLHPLTQVIREIYAVFHDLGFDVALGPELEDEFHNFDALNIPKDHPARDMQDTFWIKQSKEDAAANKIRQVLRTHTSPVQVRYMETHTPPFRIVVPGKVFRNEATDATHEAQFHQIEGLYVDKNVSMAHLKGTLETMFKKLFGDDVAIRFRPSFFPFTEPSVEVDMQWKGRWLEMGGAGLVHPNVFKAVELDPKEWQGFAFGFGIDRIAMLKFGYYDVRLSYTGDLRFINQF
ncbi:MAG: Phenylalanine--tRNA ligase alpha subunit [Candidatus Parcubacteria bacterium]|nr:Phenylalanine--tRNA ligase alpha subunit [Candidatus Parcubacteria bacterium]